MKREAKFTILFRHWLMANPSIASGAYELKQTTRDSISFSVLKEHQEEALMAVVYGEKGILYKIPDDSRGIKPFDMVYLSQAKAHVVIKYPTFFCLIHIYNFLEEKRLSNKNFLTSKRAKEISSQVIELKHNITY